MLLLWHILSYLIALTSAQFLVGPSPVSLENRFASFVNKVQDMDKRIMKLERKVSGLAQAAHSSWNSTDSGSLYKLLEQRRTWYDAENYCQSFDAHLAVIDNQAKNNFVKDLINGSSTAEYVWIGMKTQSSPSSSRNTFSNFAKDSPIDGCAVIDHAGVWSIRPCQQLRPFVCQMVLLR